LKSSWLVGDHHHAEAVGLGGDRLQIRIADLGALVLHARVRALVDRDARLEHRATVIVVGCAVKAAGADEGVAQVRRAECRGVVAAEQQGFDRPELEAKLVGGLAVRTATDVLVVVITTGQIRGEHAEDRHLELQRRGVVVALARARGAGDTPEVASHQGWIGRQAPVGVARLQHARHAHRAGRQVEQVGVGHLQVEVLRVGFRLGIDHPGDALILRGGQVLVELAVVGCIDRIAVVRAQLRPEELVLEERIHLGAQGTALLAGQVVLRTRVVGVVGPVGLAHGAAHAAGETVGPRPQTLRAGIQSAHFLGREGLLHQIEGAGVGVDEIVAGVGTPPRVVRPCVTLALDEGIQQGAVDLRGVVDAVIRVQIAAVGRARILQRGVADALLAATVVARAGPVLVAHGAAELVGDRRAGIGPCQTHRIHIRRTRPIAQDQVIARRITRVGIGVAVGAAGDRALKAPDRLGVADLHAIHHVELVGVVAADQLQALVAATATRGAAGAVIQGDALDMLLEHDVDHAGDRRGAVDRGLVAGQDVDVVDHRHRHRGQIDEVGLAVVQQRVVRHRLAVDQEQREAGRQAQQADGLGAGREAGRELAVLHRAGGQRLRAQGVVDVAETLALHLARGDGDHRRGGFDLRLRDQRAGDDHLVELLGFLFRALRGVLALVGLLRKRGCDGERQRERGSDRGNEQLVFHGLPLGLDRSDSKNCATR